jgi:hypothetical protein
MKPYAIEVGPQDDWISSQPTLFEIHKFWCEPNGEFQWVFYRKNSISGSAFAIFFKGLDEFDFTKNISPDWKYVVERFEGFKPDTLERALQLTMLNIVKSSKEINQ